ncbi:hypothetical protein N8920_08580, partial [Opitutales bacterium]|nr:hypothetical protein [Opitutales bacterium]
QNYLDGKVDYYSGNFGTQTDRIDEGLDQQIALWKSDRGHGSYFDGFSVPWRSKPFPCRAVCVFRKCGN